MTESDDQWPVVQLLDRNASPRRNVNYYYYLISGGTMAMAVLCCSWRCFAVVSRNSVHTRLDFSPIPFSPIPFSPITYNLRFELVTCNSCDAKVNGELNVERKMPRPILHRDKPNAAHYLGKQMQLLRLARYAFFQTPQMSHINREKKTAICWKRQCA